MANEKLKIVYKKIDDLIDAEYNPKGLTPKEENDITNSIKRFGFVDPLVVNVHEKRKNVLVGGHQRKKIAKKLGIEEVPCVEVNLDPAMEKELNIRLSKNTGHIDDALLAIHFEKSLLEQIGFKSEELTMFKSDFEKQFNAVTNADVPYPLVPKFSEKYDAVIIVSKNTIDTTFLENALKIGKAHSYKNSRTGKAMIIDVDHFRRAIEGGSFDEDLPE